MKKAIAIAFGVLVVLMGAMIYNVERAMHAPVTVPPSPVEIGQMQLHSQLQQVKQNEIQIEKQNWDSAAQLRILLKAHQHRIEELTGNHAAGEILTYDNDSVARIEKRIAELDALEAQQAAEPTPEQSTPSTPASQQ